MKKRYDIIIPFGYRCYSTLKLRASKKQFESFPFDWLMHGRLDVVVPIVKEHFSNFLKRENLENLYGKDYHEHLDHSNGIIFMHDFDTDDTDACFPKVRARYDRRIARFYERINEARNTLLLHYSDYDIGDEELQQLYLELSDSFPGKNIDLAYVYISNDPAQGWECRHLSNNLTKYRIEMMGSMGTLSPEDKRIFNTFDLSWKSKIKTLLPNFKYQVRKIIFTKKIINTLCWFVPGKERRQQLRSLYRLNEVYRR